METEYYEIGSVAAEKINNARRVIAVGTTSTRTLESVADKNGYVNAPIRLYQSFYLSRL